MTSTTYPKTIILDPGESIEGRFARLERGRTKDGSERAIAVFEVDGVERSLWLHETALREKLRELSPKPGELIVIIKGAEKRTSASGRDYWPVKATAPERPSTDGPIAWSDPLLGGEVQNGNSQPPVSGDPGPTPPADDDLRF